MGGMSRIPTDLVSPMMRSAPAHLHRDDATWQIAEELEDLGAPKRLAEHDRAACIGAVHLKDHLREIQPDRASLCHGRLLQ